MALGTIGLTILVGIEVNRSIDRTLTTHVGSLIRPDDLVQRSRLDEPAVLWAVTTPIRRVALAQRRGDRAPAVCDRDRLSSAR